MARRMQRGQKSQAIREYLAAHSGAMPKEVVDALAEQGVRVTRQAVSTLKARLATPSSKGKGRRRRKKPAMLRLDDLITAKQAAERLGGIDKLAAALDALASLR